MGNPRYNAYVVYSYGSNQKPNIDVYSEYPLSSCDGQCEHQVLINKFLGNSYDECVKKAQIWLNTFYHGIHPFY